MKMNFPEIYSSNEIIRYQFRANHIYILMSALINLIAGLYERPSYIHWRKIISVLASVVLNLSPFILVIAFLTEPTHASPVRPITFSGIVLMVTGVLFMFLPKIQFKD
jgi:hypothetical protein